MAANRFREDLFFRLSVFKVRLPSLRERPSDIPALVDHLLTAQGSAIRFAKLPENDRAMLLGHQWPGNVRELRNAVERLVAFPEARVETLIELDGKAPVRNTTQLPPLSVARQTAYDAFEVEYLRRALERAGDSVPEAARLAGVSRQFLLRLVKKHSLR